MRYDIGDAPVFGKKLKEATIIPCHDIYILSLVFEDATDVKMVSEKPKRICAIDLGVNNFAAITNNIGKVWIVKLFGSTKVKLNSSFLIILLYKVKLFSYA